MNQLRQLMLEELHRRNFADTTIRTYLHGVDALQPVLPAPARSAWPGGHSQVSGDAVHQVEVQPEHSHPAVGVATVLLHPRVEAWLEHRRDALSEEGASPSRGTQSGRSRATD